MTKKAWDKISIVLVQKDPESGELHPFAGYHLFKTLISGFSVSSGSWPAGKHGEFPEENMSLNFGGFEYVTYDAEGRPLRAVHHHLGTGTTTLKTGPQLEIVEVKKKQKKVKKENRVEKDEVKDAVAKEKAEDVEASPVEAV